MAASHVPLRVRPENLRGSSYVPLYGAVRILVEIGTEVRQTWPGDACVRLGVEQGKGRPWSVCVGGWRGEHGMGCGSGRVWVLMWPEEGEGQWDASLRVESEGLGLVDPVRRGTRVSGSVHLDRLPQVCEKLCLRGRRDIRGVKWSGCWDE